MTNRDRRAISARLVGLICGTLAALATGYVSATLTDRPSTATDGDGSVISLKGEHGPMWPVVIAVSGIMGAAAGLAGFTWIYTRPE